MSTWSTQCCGIRPFWRGAPTPVRRSGVAAPCRQRRGRAAICRHLRGGPGGGGGTSRGPAPWSCDLPPPSGRGAAVRRRRTVEAMTSDEQAGPDPYAEHPEESVFPGAGERVSDADRQRALDAEPAGNATVGDTVDTDDVDSRAHEVGAGAEEFSEQVDGGHQV